MIPQPDSRQEISGAQRRVLPGTRLPAGGARWPRPDGGELPDDILDGVISRLDPKLPLLLLPVRIETRYHMQVDPPELRIRIYPDQIHIDSDRPSPTVVEKELTIAFWQQWHSAREETGRKAAWKWFTGQVGARRAGHLARLLRPVPDGRGGLVFPDIKTPPGKQAPAMPALLPNKWLVIGYGIGGIQIFKKAGRPIPRNLRTGPDPEAPSWEISGSGLKIDEGLAWMVDYERAVEVGMAITIPLTGPAAQATDIVPVVLVIGINGDHDPKEASAALAHLLDVHSRTTGLAFVPQGTPTNNTADVSTGWSPEEEELAELAEKSFKEPPKAPRNVFDDNAAQLAGALGFSDAAFLRRLPHGADHEAADSRNMRTVLFEAVLGTYLRQLLDTGNKNGINANAINNVRAWFINHVTGGAPVPALRVGPQPYGILPVRRMADEPNLSTVAGQIERVVSMLMPVWRESVGQLPILEDEPGNPISTEVMAENISKILAAQPHPARIFHREMEEYIKDHTAFTIQGTYQFMIDVIHNSSSPPHILHVGEVYDDLRSQHYPGGFNTIEDQLDLWNKVKERVRQTLSGQGEELALGFIEDVLGVLNRYEGRQRPLRWMGLEHFNGVLGENNNTVLVAGALRLDTSEWEHGLVEVKGAGPGDTAADYLIELKNRFEAGDLDPSDRQSKPLLYQLIELTMPLVPKINAAQTKMRNALEGLAGVEPERLEWLLRETLGLGSHRLDAWATSLASERLERMRQEKPTGIHIGAYGWVMNLEPNRGRRLSEGFVHTHSMAHAATAAVLRTGWHAHGGSDPMSPAAVNLTSDRVRAASWLLDGVRQGQSLGDLLGYHFERYLHDTGADAQIRTVRQAVLNAQGKPKASSDQPVDGIALLELYREGKLNTLPQSLRDAVADLESTFDAVNDVSLFEAVHQVTSGNYERATAMMDSISLGTIAPPELRAPLTPRSATSVEHRVVLLLRPDAALDRRGWTGGIRNKIAPALEAWAASLLPEAGQVGFTLTPIQPDGQPGPGTAMTLEMLRLSALDAIYLVGDDPLVVPAPLRTLAAGAAEIDGQVKIDPEGGDARVSLADFTVLAIELRRLMETLRPLDARDLRPAAFRGEADCDFSPALQAVETIFSTFNDLRSNLENILSNGSKPADLAFAVETLARFGISNGSSPRDAAGAAGLLEVVRRRFENLRAIAVDKTNPLPGAEARLAVLLGRRLPVLCTFPLTAADGTVVDVHKGPASALEIDDWLDAVSRVRADVGRLFTAGMISETLGESGLVLLAGQDPLEPGEAWAAAHRPAGPGRLSIVAVSGPGGAPAVGQPACGLFVDQWSEPVPNDQQVTGLTFQFDAPNNRPPQSWLLAVPPDGEPWSLKLVTDTLLQTMEWAMLRAVGPEDLVDYGRAIPTTFVPGQIKRVIEEDGK